MIAFNFTRITNLESMKQLTVLLLFIVLGFSSSAQEADMKRIDFVSKFYAAVTSHKSSKVIKCFDKTYRKEQIKFLSGNKEQFVNELFAGTDANTEKYYNLKLEDIDGIEVFTISEQENGDRKYTFHISSGDLLIEQSLILRKTGNKYGFIGAVG